MNKLLTTTTVFLLLSVLALSGARAGYMETVLDDAPIVYHQFDDATSANEDTADNLGTFGSAHDGTYKNDVALVPGVPWMPGTAADFDGGDDYVLGTKLGNFGSNLGSGFSVEFWINTTDSRTMRAVTGMLNSADSMGWKIELNRNSSLDAQVGATNFWIRASDCKNLGAHITTDIYDGQWHHVVWVVDDPSTNDVTVYVDSLAQTLTTVEQSPSSFTNFEYTIGIGATNSRGPMEAWMDGLLDEFAIYGAPLSQDRVEAHYAAGVPEPSTLVLLAVGLAGLLGYTRRRRGGK